MQPVTEIVFYTAQPGVMILVRVIGEQDPSYEVSLIDTAQEPIGVSTRVELRAVPTRVLELARETATNFELELDLNQGPCILGPWADEEPVEYDIIDNTDIKPGGPDSEVTVGQLVAELVQYHPDLPIRVVNINHPSGQTLHGFIASVSTPEEQLHWFGQPEGGFPKMVQLFVVAHDTESPTPELDQWAKGASTDSNRIQNQLKRMQEGAPLSNPVNQSNSN